MVLARDHRCGQRVCAATGARVQALTQPRRQRRQIIFENVRRAARTGRPMKHLVETLAIVAQRTAERGPRQPFP
jgi:hypothetical protein